LFKQAEANGNRPARKTRVGGRPNCHVECPYGNPDIMVATRTKNLSNSKRNEKSQGAKEGSGVSSSIRLREKAVGKGRVHATNKYGGLHREWASGQGSVPTDYRGQRWPLREEKKHLGSRGGGGRAPSRI